MSDKPKCRLIGQDGNVFNIIGLVKRALKDSGKSDKASEFVRRAFSANSYDEVLTMAGEYVEIY